MARAERPLQALREVSQGFVNLAAALSRERVDPALHAAIAQNQQTLQGGAPKHAGCVGLPRPCWGTGRRVHARQEYGSTLSAVRAAGPGEVGSCTCGSALMLQVGKINDPLPC